MSWFAKLHDTYERSVNMELSGGDTKLLPICHMSQNAHINIILDNDGNFKRAFVDKKSISLPVTKESATRTKNDAPHALADKLQYVAKDYPEFGGTKNSYFQTYQNNLKAWCESEFAHFKVKSVYKYISKGYVIKDLINAHIILVDEDKKFLKKWTGDKSDRPKLFKILQQTKKIGDLLVCWSIEEEGDCNPDTWQDTEIFNSWIKYFTYCESNCESNCESEEPKTGFCYIHGVETVLANNHPKIIENGKLISANDNSGFTYLGKFTNKDEALGIGFEATQKAHNALSWLLSRQGYKNGNQRIVTWVISGNPLPDAFLSLYSNNELENNSSFNELNNSKTPLDMGQEFATRLNKKLSGYRRNLNDLENVIIMSINLTTEGRASITYYKESFVEEFFDKLESWYLDFAWEQYIKIPAKNKKSESYSFWSITSPTPDAIFNAVYGNNSNKDLIKYNFIQRILPCIYAGNALPIDILNRCIYRSSSKNSVKHDEWERNLGVSCALYRGFYRRHPIKTKRREYSMSLEKTNTSRDYLYGRLLAVAEKIERMALDKASEKRTTTAERLMQRFADRPYSTWSTIELSLNPYIQRLKINAGGFTTNRLKELDEIMSLFKSDEYKSDKKSTGEFLLGYHCQRQEAYKKIQTENLEENE